MHGRIPIWLASGLAILFSGPGVSWGQHDFYDPVASSVPNQVAQAQPEGQFVSAESYAPDDLASRVKKLEEALKKAEDKAAADKAKAELAPSVKVGGRVQWDSDTFDQNSTSRTTAGDALNGTEFRRLYLSLSGSMFKVVDYKAEVDLVPSHIGWRDVYLNIHDLPVVQNVRIGHQYVPFGLETETSDLNTVFVERSFIDYVGGIGNRHAGIMIFGNALEERSWWGFGAFATQKNDAPPTYPVSGFEDSGATALYGRITYLPWYDDATNGRGLWHVGISGARGEIPEIRTAGTTRYSLSAKPEANLAPLVVNTGDIPDAELINAVNAETALVYGPLSIQAEYDVWNVQRADVNGDPTFHGGYIFVSYFLTGENRVYNRKSATFVRVVPFENFFRVRAEDGCCYTGKGAWEVGYRCSYLNLNDAGIFGGRVVDHTVGLNWYLNPYTKMMFDLIHSETRDIKKGGTLYTNDSILNAFVTRVQFDF